MISVCTPEELDAELLRRKIADAMWAGDADTLNDIAPCHCCCDEHTFGPCCPAWAWAGCRGYNANGLTRHEDEQVWKAHYKRFHGMTEAEFYGSHDNDL